MYVRTTSFGHHCFGGEHLEQVQKTRREPSLCAWESVPQLQNRVGNMGNRRERIFWNRTVR